MSDYDPLTGWPDEEDDHYAYDDCAVEPATCTGCGRHVSMDRYGDEHWRVVPGTSETDKCGEYR
jgi:hypothetical protein